MFPNKKTRNPGIPCHPAALRLIVRMRQGSNRSLFIYDAHELLLLITILGFITNILPAPAEWHHNERPRRETQKLLSLIL